jgi:hypothetical protein
MSDPERLYGKLAALAPNALANPNLPTGREIEKSSTMGYTLDIRSEVRHGFKNSKMGEQPRSSFHEGHSGRGPIGFGRRS